MKSFGRGLWIERWSSEGIYRVGGNNKSYDKSKCNSLRSIIKNEKKISCLFLKRRKFSFFESRSRQA